jgi:glycosyltransferase involved in cell wall biosynthesis
VAPYEIDAYIQYSEPGKVKLLVADGFQVVITNVSKIAHEIDREKCGIMIRYERQELVEAIVKLLKNEDLLKTHRRNVPKLARKYSYDRIFAKALSALEW